MTAARLYRRYRINNQVNDHIPFVALGMSLPLMASNSFWLGVLARALADIHVRLPRAANLIIYVRVVRIGDRPVVAPALCAMKHEINYIVALNTNGASG